MLHISARYGNATMTKHFIDMGFEIDAQSNFGITPLALAVQYCHVETISVLLDAKADIYDAQQRDCLLQTVHNSYMSRRQPLKAYKRIHKIFSDRVNSDYRHDKMTTRMKLLNGKCSLHLVLMILKQASIVRYFLKNGIDVDTPESYSKCTALHAAVTDANIAVVKVLVEFGADVNARDYLGQTPLFYYYIRRKRDSQLKIEMLEYLINRGASLTLINSSNCSLMEYLLTRSLERTAKVVLRHQDDLTAMKFRMDMTPLHFLASNTSDGVLTRALQGKTFNVDARDENGNTPLMIAILKTKLLSSIEFLLDSGADVNAENERSQTPLLCLFVDRTSERVAKITMDICKLLLRRGANVQHVFKMYKKKSDTRATVFDLIVKNMQFDMSKLLIAQLVLNELQGRPIDDFIGEKIQSHEIFNEQFDNCREQIDKMKVARINETLTLYELMTVEEEDLMAHAIDFEFLSKVDELNNGVMEENCYYADIVKKRLANVVRKLKLTKEFKAVVAQPSCCIS